MLLLLAQSRHYKAPLRRGKSSEKQLESRLGNLRITSVQTVVQQSLDLRVQLIQLSQHFFLTLVKFIEKAALLLRVWH